MSYDLFSTPGEELWARAVPGWVLLTEASRHGKFSGLQSGACDIGGGTGYSFFLLDKLGSERHLEKQITSPEVMAGRVVVLQGKKDLSLPVEPSGLLGSGRSHPHPGEWGMDGHRERLH